MRTKVVVSPTPPVECLSTENPPMSSGVNMEPEWAITSVRIAASSSVMPRMHTAISNAEV